MTVKINFYSAMRITLLLILTQLMIQGCAIEKKTVPVGKPDVLSPAANLLQDAEQEMQYARYGKAEILAERALRIEPHNPRIWQLMGRIQSALNNHSESIQFLKKSNSLAGSDLQLLQQNEMLIKSAYRKTGIHSK